jgi:hypothetical protein
MTSGKLWPVSMCITGNGSFAGQKAFSARRSMTIESLPPENSSTGRSNSAATSRSTWIDSASWARTWVSSWVIRIADRGSGVVATEPVMVARFRPES